MSIPHEQPPADFVHVEADPARHAAVQRSTWVSVGVNLFLTFAQVIVGLVAHSQSLVADGLHSASDLVSDFLVLYASSHSRHPADDRHPYGHARIETAASVLLGAILAITGGAILVSGGVRLENIDQLPPVAPLALWTALLTLVAKEGLFRYMLAVAERLRSPMLVANAWHARADAASSLVVAVGIGGNLLGFVFADSLAAVIVGFMILRMGLKFIWEAMQELVDTGLAEDEVRSIRRTLLETPGVIGLHELRTRRMAHRALVDAHVQVDARISVSEGHRIAETARERVLGRHPVVLDVLVHVDAEDDLVNGGGGSVLPGREVLLAQLGPLIADLPPPQKVVLHYLHGKVEAEIFLPHSFFASGDEMVAAEARLEARLRGHRYFRSVSLNCLIAPK